jgi:hypothetical protein
MVAIMIGVAIDLIVIVKIEAEKDRIVGLNTTIPVAAIVLVAMNILEFLGLQATLKARTVPDSLCYEIMTSKYDYDTRLPFFDFYSYFFMQ